MTQSQVVAPPHQVKATFYAQVIPSFGSRWDVHQKTSVHGVTKITVAAITQSRPKKPRSGAVVVKLTLRFNEQAFMPLAPSAVIDIPDSLIQIGQVVEVEAADENGVAVAEYLASRAQAVSGA